MHPLTVAQQVPEEAVADIWSRTVVALKTGERMGRIVTVVPAEMETKTPRELARGDRLYLQARMGTRAGAVVTRFDPQTPMAATCGGALPVSLRLARSSPLRSGPATTVGVMHRAAVLAVLVPVFLVAALGCSERSYEDLVEDLSLREDTPPVDDLPDVDDDAPADDRTAPDCDPYLVGDEDGPVEAIYTVENRALAGLCWQPQ